MENQMADQRDGGIVWTDESWNPLRGCTRVSAGCMNCYAENMAARFCGTGQPYEGTINQETKRWNGTIKLVPEHLQDPLRWKRPRMVFVNSMSDLFHESVPDEFIDQVFAVMALASQHTFQVLTKRPERMLEWFKSRNSDGHHLDGFHEWASNMAHFVSQNDDTDDAYDSLCSAGWPLPNVWLGVTVENQQAADERIPLLLQTPAAVRWVSMEPLLGPVNLAHINEGKEALELNCLKPWTWEEEIESWRGTSDAWEEEFLDWYNLSKMPSGQMHNALDWIVAGGESGANARPMHPDWARSLRDQCAEAGVQFLFKQWGEWLPDNQNQSVTPPHDERGAIRVGKKAAGRLLDGKLHDGYPETKP